jgi:NADPH:quinone reductase-like Zn-dependent oxidoreductase
MTAWHMLVSRANIVAGEDVLVQAAGSGVGSAAIQIAKLFGARVITTAGTDEKLVFAKKLGADETINYKEQDFLKETKRLTGNKGVEIVIDHIGGETFEKSVRALTPNGRIVTCGATSGPTITIDTRFMFMRHLNLLGSFMGTKAELRYQMQFFADGRLKPVVDKTFELSDAVSAHERMENRQQFGKIILNP